MNRPKTRLLQNLTIYKSNTCVFKMIRALPSKQAVPGSNPGAITTFGNRTTIGFREFFNKTSALSFYLTLIKTLIKCQIKFYFRMDAP